MNDRGVIIDKFNPDFSLVTRTCVTQRTSKIPCADTHASESQRLVYMFLTHSAFCTLSCDSVYMDAAHETQTLAIHTFPQVLPLRAN